MIQNLIARERSWPAHSMSLLFKSPPPRAEIDTIIALEAQPALRNLKITQCYHDLSLAVASVIGNDNLNWCTFATWASKTAGRFVRGEPVRIFREVLQQDSFLAKKLNDMQALLLRFDAVTGLGRRAIFEAIEAPVAEVSRNIAEGNLAVFAELGPLFALICTRLNHAIKDDAGFLASLLDALQLKAGPSERGGQNRLSFAVSLFYRAKFEPDPDRKAELVLHANSQVGLHEQLRLQPAIAGALNLPFDTAVKKLFNKQANRVSGRIPLPEWNIAKPVIGDIHSHLNHLWRECVTRLFMTLRLPDGEIHLGKDLRPSRGRALFPEPLRTIEDEQLRSLLAAYRAAGVDGAESGAADWADIPERMHFILTLFRARQQDPRLFDQPFSDAQRIDIEQGRIPEGPL